MKTSELAGPALNWAVAKCEERKPSAYKNVVRATAHPDFPDSLPMFGPNMCYTTDWTQGGEIIEKESISLMKDCDDIWQASIGGCTDLDEPFWQAVGTTPLIAAMRCYVASKFGDEILVPKELENANQKS